MNFDLKAILAKLKQVFTKLTLVQKAIIGGIFLLIIVVLFITAGVSSSSGKYPLYGVSYKIKEKDLEKIIKTLKAMNVEYDLSNNQIFVKDKETAMKLRGELGLEGIIPQDLKSWELFDNQPFTTTDFEREVNLRRAITASIKKHLEALDEIEKADVVISFGEQKYFADDIANNPLTASVVITPSPGSDITYNKNKIRGLRDLIAKGVDRLKPDNIVILDHTGDVLTDKLNESEQEENIKLAKEQLKIREKLRLQITNELKNHLGPVFTPKRFDLKVNMELNWDIQKIKENLIKPVILKPDNPDTPYDDSVVQESVSISTKKTTEEFKGQGYIPEGPAGIEDQIPAGLKEKMDRYNTYTKNETIENKEISKAEVETKKDPYDIEKLTVTVFLDGLWEEERDADGELIIENGRIKRKFTPVSKEVVKQVEENLKAYLGYNPARGDKISVQAVQFDRTEEFNQQDEEMRRARRLRQIILAVIIGIISIFVLSIIYKALEREMARRRRLREEELLKQQEALRMAALKQAEHEAATAELSPEERARLELQENAIKFAKEKPEEVAKLIRTWMSTEE